MQVVLTVLTNILTCVYAKHKQNASDDCGLVKIAVRNKPFVIVILIWSIIAERDLTRETPECCHCDHKVSIIAVLAVSHVSYTQYNDNLWDSLTDLNLVVIPNFEYSIFKL